MRRIDPVELARLIRTQRILWFAFFAAMFIYLIAVLLVSATRRIGFTPPESMPTLRLLVFLLAGLGYVGAFAIRRMLLSRIERTPGSPLPAVQSAFVIGAGLMEAIAILGLILVLLGARPLDGFALLAIAFIGLVRQWPAADRLPGALRG